VKQLELQRSMRKQKASSAATVAAAVAARTATVSGPTSSERTCSTTSGAVEQQRQQQQQQQQLTAAPPSREPSSGTPQELCYGVRTPAADTNTACSAGDSVAQASARAVAARVAAGPTAAAPCAIVPLQLLQPLPLPAPAAQQDVHTLFDIWECDADAARGARPAPPLPTAGGAAWPLADDTPSFEFMDSLLDAPLPGDDAFLSDMLGAQHTGTLTPFPARFDGGSAAELRQRFNAAAFNGAFDAFSLGDAARGNASSAAAAAAAASGFAQHSAALPYRADVILKLHNVLPEHLPPELAPALFGWWASAPLAMEGHVRAGCTLLTVDALLLGNDPAAVAAAAGKQAAPPAGGGSAAELVAALLRSGAGEFLRSKRWSLAVDGRSVHVEQGGFIRPEGGDDAVPPPPPPLRLLLPVALLSTAPGRVSLRVSLAATLAGELHCRLHGQSLAVDVAADADDNAFVVLPPTGVEGVALLSLHAAADALAGRARPVLLTTDAMIVRELSVLSSDVARAPPGAARLRVQETVERTVTLMGYALHAGASADVLYAAADVALRRGWVHTSTRLLHTLHALMQRDAAPEEACANLSEEAALLREFYSSAALRQLTSLTVTAFITLVVLDIGTFAAMVQPDRFASLHDREAVLALLPTPSFEQCLLLLQFVGAQTYVKTACWVSRAALLLVSFVPAARRVYARHHEAILAAFWVLNYLSSTAVAEYRLRHTYGLVVWPSSPKSWLASNLIIVIASASTPMRFRAKAAVLMLRFMLTALSSLGGLPVWMTGSRPYIHTAYTAATVAACMLVCYASEARALRAWRAARAPPSARRLFSGHNTLLHSAVASAVPELVALTLALSGPKHVFGKPASRGFGGITPLHLAATLPHADIAQLLTAHSADASLAWFTCRTASDVAGLGTLAGMTPAMVALAGAAQPFNALRDALLARLPDYPELAAERAVSPSHSDGGAAAAGRVSGAAKSDAAPAPQAHEVTPAEYSAWCFVHDRVFVAIIAFSQNWRSLVTLWRAANVRDAAFAEQVASTMRPSEILVVGSSSFFNTRTGAYVALETLPWPIIQQYAATWFRTFFFTRLLGNVMLFSAMVVPRLRPWASRHFGSIYFVAAMLEVSHSPLAEYLALYRPHGIVLDYCWMFAAEHFASFLVLSGIFVRGTFSAAGSVRLNMAMVWIRMLCFCGCLLLSPVAMRTVALRSPHVLGQLAVSLATTATVPWNDRRLHALAAKATAAAATKRNKLVKQA
jgi:hypothetical protein